MASIVSPEVPLKPSSSSSAAAPPSSAPSSSDDNHKIIRKGASINVGLRISLFASTLVAIIVMVTSKQTKMISVAPGVTVPVDAKFNQEPAFIYFISALSVACFYSIITGILSIRALMKPAGGISTKLHFRFVMFDALVLGIVASATGAASGVGYIGLKGNSHSRWNKICNTFGSFCFHFKASILLSLSSSITLLLLVWLYLYVLSKKIPSRRS